MFIQSRTLQGPRTSNAKAKRRKPSHSPERLSLTPTLARMLHTNPVERSVRSTPMHYVNHQPVPVFSSDEKPLMPCHPARTRKLLAQGRAVLHHIKGIFAI